MHGVSLDRINLNKAKEAVTHGGLGVITAGIFIFKIFWFFKCSTTTTGVFLAGEMAGSGVLALPNAMMGTGGELEPGDCTISGVGVVIIKFNVDI